MVKKKRQRGHIKEKRNRVIKGRKRRRNKKELQERKFNQRRNITRVNGIRRKKLRLRNKTKSPQNNAFLEDDNMKQMKIRKWKEK